MNYFYALTTCLLLFVCSAAQTTICINKGDSIFAGGSDRSRIKSIRDYYFVYDGPLDTSVTNSITRIAANSPDIKTFSTSCVLLLKDLYTDYFSGILHDEPVYFDQQVMRNQVSTIVGRICFFGFENSKAVLLDAVIYINKGVKHPVVISYSLQPQYLSFLSTGYKPRYKGVLGNLGDGGGALEIKRFIGMGTDGPVDGSGPPIDVLVLTKNGKRWIRK